MFRKILALLSLIPACYTSSAQTNQAPFHIELAAGVTLPVGQFADKTFEFNAADRKPSGLAKPGFTGNLSLLYELKNNLGILVTGGMSFNKQDAESYRKWAVGSSNNTTAYPDVNSWKILHVMAGGFYTFRSGTDKRAYFRASGSVGVCNTAVPGFSVTSQNGNQLSYVTQVKQSLPLGFCFQAQMEFYYQLFKSVYWHVETSFFDGSIKKHYHYYPNFPNTDVLVSATRTYNISTVNFLGGVGMRF